MKNRGFTSQHGFSLIELLIVVVIISIIAALTILAFQRTMAVSKLDTAVSILSSSISEARSNAIKHNRRARLAITPADRSVQVTVDPLVVTDPPLVIGYREILPTGVEFNGVPPAEIVFDSMGRLTTPALTVTLASEGDTEIKALTVSAAGKVTLQAMTAN